MRWVIAIAELVLLASGSRGQEYTVVNKMSEYTVVNRMAVAQVSEQTPRREFWPGYGWVEWRNGGWWRMEVQPAAPQQAPGVAQTPFPGKGQGITAESEATPAPTAVAPTPPPTRYAGGQAATTSTGALAGPSGSTSAPYCASPFG